MARSSESEILERLRKQRETIDAQIKATEARKAAKDAARNKQRAIVIGETIMAKAPEELRQKVYAFVRENCAEKVRGLFE